MSGATPFSWTAIPLKTTEYSRTTSTDATFVCIQARKFAWELERKLSYACAAGDFRSRCLPGSAFVFR